MNRLVLSLILLVSLTFGAIALTPASVIAATPGNCTKSSAGFLGFPTWYKYLSPTFNATTRECQLKFDIQKDIGRILLAVFEIILRVAGMVAVGFIIYGGFEYLFSQAEPEKVKNARWTIINAVIGLGIAISATAIVNLIGRNI